MNPLLALQATGNSNRSAARLEPMRRAGATARVLLVMAAASAGMSIPRRVAPRRAKSSTPQRSPPEVRRAGGRRREAAGAGEGRAETLCDFKLIGTPAKRLDTPAKVNGTAVYGIDARVPGMKIATLAQSPVFGGRLRSVDDSKAKAVRGVRQIVRLDDCVAVVADHMGAAKKGLAALVIEWDDGPNAKLSTADIVGDYEQASQRPGAVARSEGDNAKAMAAAATKVSRQSTRCRS